MTPEQRPKVPESTAQDWRYFRRVKDVASGNSIVSIWLWEYSREALVSKPECLDWLWKWRQKNSQVIRAVLDGERNAIQELKRTDTGFPLAPWMVCPQFPLESLEDEKTWCVHNLLVNRLITPDKLDGPSAGQIRKRFYPFGRDGEVFPLLQNYQFDESLQCIVVEPCRAEQRKNSIRLIVPVEIDLTQSNDFLAGCFRDLVVQLRSRFEETRGKVKVRDQKGFNSEQKKKASELKELSAIRLAKSVKTSKDAWEDAYPTASQIAKEYGIKLYSANSRSSWDRARTALEERVRLWTEKLDALNGGRWAEAYLKKLAAVEARRGSSSNTP